jgi:hypothetical protein
MEAILKMVMGRITVMIMGQETRKLSLFYL